MECSFHFLRHILVGHNPTSLQNDKPKPVTKKTEKATWGFGSSPFFTSARLHVQPRWACLLAARAATMGDLAARIAALEAELAAEQDKRDAALVRCKQRPIGRTRLPLCQLHADVQALIVMQLATDTEDLEGSRSVFDFVADFRALRQLCQAARSFGGDGLATPLQCEMALSPVIEEVGPYLLVEQVLRVSFSVTPPFEWRLNATLYGPYACAYRNRYASSEMKRYTLVN